jgi:drug/metabolite transporter (DMT)-like permease
VTSLRQSPRLLGAGLVVIAAISFGTLGPLSRFAGEAGVESLSLVTWRATLGGLCMLAFLAARMAAGQHPVVPFASLPVRERWTIVAAAAANTVLNFSVFVAFGLISIALALLVFYLYPAIVAIASVVWFGDRLDRVRWGALAISMVGCVMVVAGAGSLGEVNLAGIGLALVGALAQAFYVLAARHGFARVPGTQAAATTMLLAALFYLAIAGVMGQLNALAQPLASSAALWPVVAAGVVGAGVPTVCFITGIRLLGPPRAAILATLEPVVGVGLAALLLREQPTLVQLAGGAFIIAAAILLQVRAPSELAEHEAVGEEKVGEEGISSARTAAGD